MGPVIAEVHDDRHLGFRQLDWPGPHPGTRQRSSVLDGWCGGENNPLGIPVVNLGDLGTSTERIDLSQGKRVEVFEIELEGSR